MNMIKTIFAWLGRFLQKVRNILLDLTTALFVLFFAATIIGALTSSEPEFTDPSGRVLFIDPEGIVVDQEIFSSDSVFDLAADSPAEQIQTRDLIKLIREPLKMTIYRLWLWISHLQALLGPPRQSISQKN